MPEAEDDLLTSTQAGLLLGKSGKTVLRMAEAGLLPVAHRIAGRNGEQRLFRRGDVVATAESQAATA